MPVQIAIPFRKRLEFQADLSAVFHYIADVKTNVPKDFPGVESFDEIGPSTYRWIFEKIGYSGYELAIQFDTLITTQANSWVAATPTGSGKTRFRAKWTFSGDTNKTTVDLDAELDLELPIPGFLKGMAAPITQREITGLFESYAAAVVTNFRA